MILRLYSCTIFNESDYKFDISFTLYKKGEKKANIYEDLLKKK